MGLKETWSNHSSKNRSWMWKRLRLLVSRSLAASDIDQYPLSIFLPLRFFFFKWEQKWRFVYYSYCCSFSFCMSGSNGTSSSFGLANILLQIHFVLCWCSSFCPLKVISWWAVSKTEFSFEVQWMPCTLYKTFHPGLEVVWGKLLISLPDLTTCQNQEGSKYYFPYKQDIFSLPWKNL